MKVLLGKESPMFCKLRAVGVGWLPVAALVVVGLLGPGAVRKATGQANSDFMAYPKNLTDYTAFNTVSKNIRQLTFNRMPGLSPDYRIGPGDELELTIIGMFSAPQTLRVNELGEITIPLVGAVAVAGRTAEQLESEVANTLKEKGLIADPEVLVYISQYEAKTIYVVGEVDRPGEYSVSFEMTLMDLIFLAGGIDFTAARYGYLHRRAGAGPPAWRPVYVQADATQIMRRPDVAQPGEAVTEIDLQPMKEGGVLARNIVLRDGDVFYVPRRKIDIVYVIGDVLGPGAFELPEGKRMTAAQAISLAGGPAKTAKMSKGMLVRYEADGRRREFAVDFAAILKGKQADMDVRPNDVIFVPGSSGKTVAYGLLNTIPNLVTTAILF